MLTLTALMLLSSTSDAGITRLDLARTWEAAQLFHPAVIHREVDLDGAFVTAVKALAVAKTEDEQRAAVGLVLAPLKDPSSRVLKPGMADQEKLVSTRPGVTVVHAASAELTLEFYRPGALEEVLGVAERVVVDLRGVPDESPVFGLTLNTSRAVTLPAVQSLAHEGYDATPGSRYRTRLEVNPGASFKADPAAGKRKWALVLGAPDTIPDWALALREAGDAVFVSNEKLTDDGALPFTTVKLADGWVARVRSSEFVGGQRVQTDVLVQKGQDVLTAAAKALTSGAKMKPGACRGVAEPLRPFALGAVTKDFPDAEHRLLAGLRLWLISKRFWAYPALRKADPDAELLTLFSVLENATTPRKYGDAIRAAAAKLVPDSHAVVRTSDGRGTTWAPFDATFVEDKPVISVVTPNAGPLKKWDVLLEIGGVKVSDALAELMPLMPAPRDDGRRLVAMQYVLSRTDGEKVQVVVDRAGQRITAELTWSAADAAALFETPAPGPHFKVLEGNLGYIDVVNLEPDEIEPAMAAVQKTRGLVFDLRGYPKGTGFHLGVRLGAEKSIPGMAMMCVPVVRSQAQSDRTCEFFLQQEAAWEGVRYTAPTATLINLDAISQAEHVGLIFEAYGHTTFVGSPTRGANGTIARMHFPGGARMTFTGMEVRHADGRQLQGVGIVPDVVVRPTMAGLRAGKDEVMERALSVLRAKLK